MPPRDSIGFVYDTDIMKHRAGAFYRWALLPSNAVFFDIVAEDSGCVLDSGTVLVISAADAAYELDRGDGSWSYEDFVILMSKVGGVYACMPCISHAMHFAFRILHFVGKDRVTRGKDPTFVGDASVSRSAQGSVPCCFFGSLGTSSRPENATQGESCASCASCALICALRIACTQATFHWSDAALDEVEAAAKADANFLGGERSVTHINTIRC